VVFIFLYEIPGFLELQNLALVRLEQFSALGNIFKFPVFFPEIV
jgi:hypothetical protein